MGRAGRNVIVVRGGLAGLAAAATAAADGAPTTVLKANTNNLGWGEDDDR